MKTTRLQSRRLSNPRRAVAIACFAAILPLGACAELTGALNTAAQGYVAYQQTEAELARIRREAEAPQCEQAEPAESVDAAMAMWGLDRDPTLQSTRELVAEYERLRAAPRR